MQEILSIVKPKMSVSLFIFLILQHSLDLRLFDKKPNKTRALILVRCKSPPAHDRGEDRKGKFRYFCPIIALQLWDKISTICERYVLSPQNSTKRKGGEEQGRK